MNEILEKLLRLQRLDTSIRTLGHDLQQIPKKAKVIDEKVSSVKAPLDRVMSEMETLLKGRQEAEDALKSLEEKERKLKLKMPEIRSNEEYSALLKEMDATKKAREVLEEQTLKDMARLEEIEGALPDLKKKYEEGESHVSQDRGALKKEQDRLSSEILSQKKERQELQKSMHPGWFNKYTHIAAQRNGLAVVEAKGGICQGCFMSVRPKLIQDLHYGEEVVFCEGCQRILFLENGSGR